MNQWNNKLFEQFIKDKKINQCQRLIQLATYQVFNKIIEEMPQRIIDGKDYQLMMKEKLQTERSRVYQKRSERDGGKNY